MNKFQRNVLYCFISIILYKPQKNGAAKAERNATYGKAIRQETEKRIQSRPAATPRKARCYAPAAGSPSRDFGPTRWPKRVAAGQQNFDSTPATRTEKQIALRNICTLFNLVNIIFFVAILLVGSLKDSLFMAIVAANTAIGIIQEIRAKRSIDQLNFLTAAKAKVVRDGETAEIPIEEIVLDDILILSAGDQVPTDCIAVSGFCEADESFLTGESDAISKNLNDTLLAGSFYRHRQRSAPGPSASAAITTFPRSPPRPKQ